jgi:hypothetical protein
MSVPPAAKKIKCPNCESVYVKKRPRSAEDQLTVLPPEYTTEFQPSTFTIIP